MAQISIHMENDQIPKMRIKVFNSFECIEFYDGVEEVAFYLHGIDISEKFVDNLRTAYAIREIQR